MTQIGFNDRKKEIRVKTEAKLYFADDWKKHIDLKFLKKNKEFFSFFDNMRISRKIDDEISLKQELDYYKYLIDSYITESKRVDYKKKILCKNGVMMIPIALYLIIMIRSNLITNLDSLWYYVNLDAKNMKSDFMKGQNRLLNLSTLIFSQIVCRWSYVKDYVFDKIIYKKLKELLKDFTSIDNKNSDVLLLRDVLTCVDFDEEDRIFPLRLSKEEIEEIKGGLKSKEYYIREESPNTLDYMLFKLLFLEECPIIVITKWVWNVEIDVWYNIFITDEDWVKDLVRKWESFITINPFSQFKEMMSKWFLGDVWDHIITLKEKIKKNLWDLSAPIEKVAEDMENFRKTAKNGSLIVDIHNEEYLTMVWNFASTDFERYEELDNYVWDYWFITTKRNGSRPKTIVWEKQYKYK